MSHAKLSFIQSSTWLRWRPLQSVVMLVLLWLSLGGVRSEEVWGSNQEVQCKGTLGRIVVRQLRVPRGFTCHLNGTQVTGRIVIEPRATLRTTDADLEGNIRAYGGHRLKLDSQTKMRGTLYRSNTPR